MSKHIRYTCAKKKHPVLKKDCEKCEMYNPCAKDGKWCFVGALVAEHEPAVSEITAGESALCAAAPVLRDQSTVTIHLGERTSVDVFEEDFMAQLKNSLNSSISRVFDPGRW